MSIIPIHGEWKHTDSSYFIEKQCEECHSIFSVQPCLEKRRFCSKECYLQARHLRHYIQPNGGGNQEGQPELFRKLSTQRKGHTRENCACGVAHNFGGNPKGYIPKNLTDNLLKVRVDRIQTPNGRFASPPQMELYYAVKSRFSEAVLEYPIRTLKTVRFADIAIPSLKLDIEYDGKLHNPIEDLERDRELAQVGWTTIRFNRETFRRWAYADRLI